MGVCWLVFRQLLLWCDGRSRDWWSRYRTLAEVINVSGTGRTGTVRRCVAEVWLSTARGGGGIGRSSDKSRRRTSTGSTRNRRRSGRCCGSGRGRRAVQVLLKCTKSSVGVRAFLRGRRRRGRPTQNLLFHRLWQATKTGRRRRVGLDVNVMRAAHWEADGWWLGRQCRSGVMLILVRRRVCPSDRRRRRIVFLIV